MGKESLDVKETIEMMQHVASVIIESEPILTDADRNLGDGDHGFCLLYTSPSPRDDT